jgi:polyhydroxyalkanoic acid synthase PhaR subunit
MSQKSENSTPFDPTGMFKGVRDAGMDAWSKMMIQLVNSEAYSQATATVLDAWLTTSAPFRKAVESTMTQVLTQLNMPTRTDVTSLAERLTHIEMRLDDLEAKLDERVQPAPKAAPSKTKETPA